MKYLKYMCVIVLNTNIFIPKQSCSWIFSDSVMYESWSDFNSWPDAYDHLPRSRLSLSDLTKIPSHFSFDQLTHFLEKLNKNQELQENIPILQNTTKDFYVLRLLNMDILQKWGKNHFQGVKPKLKILVDKSKVTWNNGKYV